MYESLNFQDVVAGSDVHDEPHRVLGRLGLPSPTLTGDQDGLGPDLIFAATRSVKM